MSIQKIFFDGKECEFDSDIGNFYDKNHTIIGDYEGDRLYDHNHNLVAQYDEFCSTLYNHDHNAIGHFSTDILGHIHFTDNHAQLTAIYKPEFGNIYDNAFNKLGSIKKLW